MLRCFRVFWVTLNKVSKKPKVTEKLIAQAAKEQGLAFSKRTGGYARAQHKSGSFTPRPAMKKRRGFAQQSSGVRHEDL